MGPTIKDLLAKTTSPERVKRVCLNGKLRGEHDALRDELDEVTARPSSKMAADPRVAELAERITAIEAEMAESTVAFRFRGLSRWRLQEIKKKFPSEDKNQEWDVDAAAPQFIAECLVDPELSEAEVKELLGKGNSRLADELFSTAWLASNQENDVPKSARASELIRGSGSK